MIRSTQLANIILNESTPELLSFLWSLTDDERLMLAPYLQSLNQDYMSGEASRSADVCAKVQMLTIASFVCLDRTAFEQRRVDAYLLNESVLSQVLPWHCPGWFSDYVNQYAATHYLPLCFSYEYLLHMMQRGWVRPHEEVVVQYLPQIIYELHDHQWVYCPENITKHAITLEQHIWYLFRYETNINWSDQYLCYGERAAADTDWRSTLKLLAQGNLISRARLLRETLAAISRPFNASLHQWFVDLLDYLAPEPAELLSAAVSADERPTNREPKSLGEVCQQLFAAAGQRPAEISSAPQRTIHALPVEIPASREAQPYWQPERARSCR